MVNCMQSLLFFFRRPALLGLGSAALLWVLNSSVALAATNTAPTISRQPASGAAGIGEDFVFSVEATGALPLKYQWRFLGTNLPGATASSLSLTNLNQDQAGSYYVIITNTSGSVTSSIAILSVPAIFPRRLSNGRVLVNSSQVAVPIILRANGRENAVYFSLSYNTNAYSNPLFLAGEPSASVVTNAPGPGLIGIALVLPPAATFPAGYVHLGLLQFDLAPGAAPLQGGLAFATNAFPIAALNPSQQGLRISAAIQPQFALVTPSATLDRQSGLFKQQMIVANPGAALMTNVNVLPVTLGKDTRTNAIVFYNGIAQLGGYPFGDPFVEVKCNCDCGYIADSASGSCDFTNYLNCANATNCSVNAISTNINFTFAQVPYLAAGESRMLTLEFYVSDHITAPPAAYDVYASAPVTVTAPSGLTPVTITTNRYVNGTFMIEFPTQLDHSYYVQYANNASFTNALTAFPGVLGTGSRVQWIDDGPPKTILQPANGSRFYRVFQTP